MESDFTDLLFYDDQYLHIANKKFRYAGLLHLHTGQTCFSWREWKNRATNLKTSDTKKIYTFISNSNRHHPHAIIFLLVLKGTPKQKY